MKIKLLIFISLLLFFVGCANKLNMGYYSALDRGYVFNPNAPIVIMHDKDDLLTESYVNLIVYQLSLQGFNSVYKEKDLPLSRAKNAVYVKVFRNIQAYPSVNYSYSVVGDGAMRSCYWYGDKFYCDDKANKILALSGYSENLNYHSSYHFVLDWYDTNLKKRVLYVDGSVNGKTCGYNLLIPDLIKQTIRRLDFSRAERYMYFSDLPYYWPCN